MASEAQSKAKTAEAAADAPAPALSLPAVFLGTPAPRRAMVLLGLNALVLVGCGVFFYYRHGRETEETDPAPVEVGERLAPAGPSPAAESPGTKSPAAQQSADPSVAAQAPAAKPAFALASEAPPAAAASEAEALSWARAEQAAAGGRYREALEAYERLIQRSEASGATPRVLGLVRLRAARCLTELRLPHEARKALASAAESGSPLVRGLACYEMARMDAGEGQHLRARARAYQSLAVVGGQEAAAALVPEVEFLAAWMTAARALAVLNCDLPAPVRPPAAADPFAGLDEAQVRALVDEGAAGLASAVLGPQLRVLRDERGGRVFDAASDGAPLEELLLRLTAESGLQVRWENVAPAARRRPLVLAMTGVGEHRLVETACGAVGLVARFTGSEVLVADPTGGDTTAGVGDLLQREAVSAWRRLFLRHTDEERLAYGHYAVGLLLERAGDLGSAMAEYQVVVRRFRAQRLAPLARLRTATLKVELRDYAGARAELLDLLNQYPDCPASDEVYLRLGQATLETGSLDEAAATFKKLYFMDLSLPSKAGASLGAGRCYFRQGRYDEAAVWLGRRAGLPRSPAADADLAEAYSLLAKTEAARGRLGEAAQAYKDALAASEKGEGRIGTLLALSRILVQQQDLVAALGILDGLGPKDATAAQADEVLLARAEILRAMGLAERAISLIRRGLPAAASPQAGHRMTLLLGQCLADGGDPEGARGVLNDVLPKVAAGPLAQQTALALADACLRAGQDAQAVAVCRELLRTACPDDVRRAAQEMLGRAYMRQKDCERAVMALSGLTADEQGATGP